MGRRKRKLTTVAGLALAVAAISAACGPVNERDPETAESTTTSPESTSDSEVRRPATSGPTEDNGTSSTTPQTTTDTSGPATGGFELRSSKDSVVAGERFEVWADDVEGGRVEYETGDGSDDCAFATGIGTNGGAVIEAGSGGTCTVLGIQREPRLVRKSISVTVTSTPPTTRPPTAGFKLALQPVSIGRTVVQGQTFTVLVINKTPPDLGPIVIREITGNCDATSGEGTGRVSYKATNLGSCMFVGVDTSGISVGESFTMSVVAARSVPTPTTTEPEPTTTEPEPTTTDPEPTTTTTEKRCHGSDKWREKDRHRSTWTPERSSDDRSE